VERFHLTRYEKEENERKSMQAPSNAFQRLDEDFWSHGKFRMQSKRGRKDGEVCPIVAQANAEKLAKRKRKMDPSHGTIQSQWHGGLKDAQRRGEDWANRPAKYDPNHGASNPPCRMSVANVGSQVVAKTSATASVTTMSM